MPGRTFWGNDEYRFGVNGVERSPEIGSGHHNTYFRELDTRTGRWWSTDPVIHSWESPYATFANNPVFYSDPSGADPDPKPKRKKGEKFLARNGKKLTQLKDEDKGGGFEYQEDEIVIRASDFDEPAKAKSTRKNLFKFFSGGSTQNVNTTSTPAPFIPGPAPGVGTPGSPINTPGPASGTGSPGGVRPPGGPGLAPPIIGMSAAAAGTIAIASLSVASDTRPKTYITLYRGVNVEHGKYEESKQGIVTPNYMRSWWGWITGKKREATAREHNSKEGAILYSPYTSWTSDIDVAINFALRPQKSFWDRNKQNGVVLTIRVETWEAIKTEKNKDVNLIHKEGRRSESEYLIRGYRIATDVQELDIEQFEK